MSKSLAYLKESTDLAEEIIELTEIEQEDIDIYVKEMDYLVSKRKFFEKQGPVGHLVLPIYNKFKSRHMKTSNVIAKSWTKALKTVIDWKAGPGTGRRTCLGGTLDDIHLIQAYLNPLYKHLKISGIQRRRVMQIHSEVDLLMESIKTELPQLFPADEPQIEPVANEDEVSDAELIALNTQKQKINKSERERWLDYKHDEEDIKQYKYDSTKFWEKTGRKLFLSHAILYYRVATKHPAEALVERFFSTSKYVTGNKRGKTGLESMRTISMRSIWGE